MVLIKAIGVLAESDPQDYEEATFKVEVELGQDVLGDLIDLLQIAAEKAGIFPAIRSAVAIRELLVGAQTAGLKARDSRIEADKSDQKALARLQGRG